MSRISKPLLAIALVLASASVGTLGPASPAAATPFVVEVVDGASTNVGAFAALAIDGDGRTRVAYYDVANGNLKYAIKAGGTWSLDTADASANSVGLHCGLAIDIQGNPHVSYYDATTGDLKYARKSGGVWTRETAESSASDVGQFTSIALDASGNPFISYYDATAGDLKVARKVGGVWTREVADGSGIDAGRFSAIALDVAGNIHVSYQNTTAGDLKYAQKAFGAWATETAEAAANNIGRHTAIVLDELGQPHISYTDSNAADVRYAHKLNGTWTRETVDGAASAVGLPTTILLDSQGNPHVMYSDTALGDIKYARKTTGTWTRETVDAASDNLLSTASAFAFDPSGNPVVAYYSSSAGDLRIADSGVGIAAPVGAETWPVGSSQAVSWGGVGPVDISLSSDGGSSFVLLAEGVLQSPVSVRVPHVPTRFARIRVRRASPLAIAESDSFFQIDATIVLLKFDASARDAEGSGSRTVTLTWDTSPGPEAQIRYRLERAAGAGGSGSFAPLHAGLLDGGEYVDLDPPAAARYRLIGVNGLGEEYLLGEAASTAALSAERDIAVSPNPALRGESLVLYRVPSERPIDLAVFDVGGRRVRTLASGRASAGVQSIRWDGRDDAGHDLPAGHYFLRLSSGQGFAPTERLTVIR